MGPTPEHRLASEGRELIEDVVALGVSDDACVEPLDARYRQRDEEAREGEHDEKLEQGEPSLRIGCEEANAPELEPVTGA